MSKVSICLWFGKDAEAAVRFYVALVPGSSIEHILRSPATWPGGARTAISNFWAGSTRR